MTTVEEFLQPPLGPVELGHVVWVKEPNKLQKPLDPVNSPDVVSGNAQDTYNSANSRFAPLAEAVELWSDFDVRHISSDPSIAPCLSRPCQVRWEPQIPEYARVIYSERQLEALYLQTLVTRVNIALDMAIPPEEERITILVGPGAFESVSAEATAQWLLPDWIIVQGDFSAGMETDSLLALQDLVVENRILAVGDTKLVRQWDDRYAIAHTRGCYQDFLRQLQEYCVNLGTRFGFILSNMELLVMQVVGAQEASPRMVGQRGLRSRTNGAVQAQRLETSLEEEDSQMFDSSQMSGSSQMSDSSQTAGYNGGGVDDPYELPSLSTSFAQVPSKRPHPSTSPETSPIHATAATATAAASPPWRSNGDDASQNLSGSDPPVSREEGTQASSSQDHSKYTSSVRDVEVEALQIRSFDVMAWGEDGEDGEDSPYKVLFTFVMMIRALRLRKESINI